MKTWVKLYTEINRDPKMLRLTWAQRGIWCALLALAGEIDDEDGDGPTGLLGSPEDVALLIRCDDQEFAEAIAAFEARGMVQRRGGLLYLPHFAERQKRKPSSRPDMVAERVRRHRRATMANDGDDESENDVCNTGVTPPDDDVTPLKRECNADVTPLKRECNADVTPLKHPVTPPDTDTDTETEGETDPPYIPPTLARGGAADASRGRGLDPPLDRVAAQLQRTLERAGILVGSAMQFEVWRGVLEEDAGGDLDLFTESLAEAMRQNKRTPAYVGAIARRCRERGERPTDRASPQKRKTPLAEIDKAIRAFREAEG